MKTWKIIHNPLRRRVVRELMGECKKYIVIALFLILTIGFVSGMYVANGSMLQTADESVEKYQLEDGHFELKEKADKALLSAIESGEKADLLSYYEQKAKDKVDEQLTEQLGPYQEAYASLYEEAYEKAQEEVEEQYERIKDRFSLDETDFQIHTMTICENFFKEAVEKREKLGGDADTTQGKIRVYTLREQMNLPCVMEGTLPSNENEIAIDRMHADNVGLSVGDTLTVGGKTFTISGLVANVDYTTLFEKNTEIMFDAINFDIGLLTKEGFERVDNALHYNYAFRYTKEAGQGAANAPDSDVDKKSWSDGTTKVIITQALAADNELESYLPTYANQAVQFTTDDMGSDKAMGGVLLYILIAVLAFVFAITISNTIQKEASVIGTLRASGYTRGELQRHYMTCPMLVTILSAMIGNVLGYTVFKDVVVGMYYNSYSLPAYETVFSLEALVKTTIIPVILMFVINNLIIAKQLRATPLQFLRHDLKKTRRKKAMRLPRWKFLSRFRLRVLLQNIPGYLVLFLGIWFVMLLLAMAIGMPDTLTYYKGRASELALADYQTTLTSYKDADGEKFTTRAKGAEEVGLKSLLLKSSDNEESTSVYGIKEDSAYVQLPSLSGDEVYISSALADKYHVKKGDVLTLDAQYENRSYSFQVKGIWDYDGGVAVFLSMDQFRDTFELEEDAFSGFFSEEEITDIPSKYIGAVLTPDSITKIVAQLEHSMGSYMTYFQVLCAALAGVLMYLLTKLIIEQNEKAISMTKILGYNTREIASVYLISTTWVIILAEILGLILGTACMQLVWNAMMLRMEGWFSFVMQPAGYVKAFLLVFAAYLLVSLLDFARIRRIPMDMALKNVE